MFTEWKEKTNQYIENHLEKKQFSKISADLDTYIKEISNHYIDILLENNIINSNGEDTGVDYDEDDLFEGILDRFVFNHDCDESTEMIYALLIDQYLRLVAEISEDI